MPVSNWVVDNVAVKKQFGSNQLCGLPCLKGDWWSWGDSNPWLSPCKRGSG